MQKKFNLHQLLSPESHPLNEQTDLCYICFDIKVDPIICSTCKATFCNYCADTWKKNNNSCPNRCSPKWQYTPASPLQLKLRCPYSCPTIITPNQFVNHIKTCTNLEFSYEKLKSQYLCNFGHQLKYISDYNQVSMDAECALCFTTKSICRSSCQECKEKGEKLYTYCSTCRFPQGFTKTCCPAGHNEFYIKSSWKSKHTYCDFCSEQVGKKGKGCVEDKECDFAICYGCFMGLENGPGEVLDFEAYQEAEEEQGTEPNLSFEQLMQQIMQSLNMPQNGNAVGYGLGIEDDEGEEEGESAMEIEEAQDVNQDQEEEDQNLDEDWEEDNSEGNDGTQDEN